MISIIGIDKRIPLITSSVANDSLALLICNFGNELTVRKNNLLSIICIKFDISDTILVLLYTLSFILIFIEEKLFIQDKSTILVEYSNIFWSFSFPKYGNIIFTKWKEEVKNHDNTLVKKNAIGNSNELYSTILQGWVNDIW